MSREYTRAEPMIDAHVALISEQLITAAALTHLIDCAACHHPNLAEQTHRVRSPRKATETTVSATVGWTHPYFFIYPLPHSPLAFKLFWRKTQIFSSRIN